MGYQVSVLVPIYDVEQYIERCARSVFGQTYPDLEYVFVNDCTPDKSVEVLEKVMEDYPERRGTVKIVTHERNRGLAAARNTGVANATGEFVCLVDTDDWMEPNALELLVKKQLEHDASMVSGNRMVHYLEKESLLQERKYQNSEEMTLQMMQRTWDHFITGRLFRRSLFLDHGLRWNEGLDVAEDRLMMTLLAYYTQRFDTVDAVVYHYERRNEQALTKTSDRRRIFRNNDQELRNMLSLQHFFGDKEAVFSEGCLRCVAEQQQISLRTAASYASRSEYDSIVRLLEDEGRHPHSFRRMRWVCLKDKAVRFVKKRLCKKNIGTNG